MHLKNILILFITYVAVFKNIPNAHARVLQDFEFEPIDLEPSDYDHWDELQLSPDLHAQWYVNLGKEQITFIITVPCSAWIYFGLSTTGKIIGSDGIAGDVSDNGNADFQDVHIDSAQAPVREKISNWFYQSETETDGFTTVIKLAFYRKFVTGDPNDIDITENGIYLIWSFNPTPDDNDVPIKMQRLEHYESKFVNLLSLNTADILHENDLTDESSPTEDTYPTEDTSPAEDTFPTEESTITEESDPTEATTSTQETTPTDESNPTESSDPTTPSEETTPDDESTPIEDTTPSEETTPVEDTTPSEQTTSTDESAPTEETTPTEDTTPTEEFTPTEDTTPTDEKSSPTPQTSTTAVTTPSTEPPEGVFSRTEILSAEVTVTWIVDMNTQIVKFIVTAITTGYVGFGISDNGNMFGADLIIGGVSNGNSYFGDYYSTQPEQPSKDILQDWNLSSATETNGITELQFSRSFNTDDKQDLRIQNHWTNFIWALGSTDNIEYHESRRGSFPVNILDPKPSREETTAMPIQTTDDSDTTPDGSLKNAVNTMILVLSSAGLYFTRF